MPKPVSICYRFGGGWYTWERHLTRQYSKGDNDRFYAVQFDDGSIFDTLEGWKPAEAK